MTLRRQWILYRFSPYYGGRVIASKVETHVQRSNAVARKSAIQAQEEVQD